MSWRNGLKSALDAASKSRGSFSPRQRISYDFESLLTQIGDRDAVVDACLPPQLARDLRERNINAIWVPSVLGDGASDEEIERQLLIGEGLLWESRSEEKVLLTRDVKFYRRLRKRAILVKYRPQEKVITSSRGVKSRLRNLSESNQNRSHSFRILKT